MSRRTAIANAYKKTPIRQVKIGKFSIIDIPKLKKEIRKNADDLLLSAIKKGEDDINAGKKKRAAKIYEGNARKEAIEIVRRTDGIIIDRMNSLSTQIQTEGRNNILRAANYDHRIELVTQYANRFLCEGFSGTQFGEKASLAMTPNRPRMYGVNIGLLSSIESVRTVFPDSTATGGFAKYKRSQDDRKYSIPYWYIVEFGTLNKFNFEVAKKTAFSPLMFKWTHSKVDPMTFPDRVLSDVRKHKSKTKYVPNKAQTSWKTKDGRIRHRSFIPNSFMVIAKKPSRLNKYKGLQGVHVIYKLQTKYRNRPSQIISSVADSIIKAEKARAINEARSYLGA